MLVYPDNMQVAMGVTLVLRATWDTFNRPLGTAPVHLAVWELLLQLRVLVLVFHVMLVDSPILLDPSIALHVILAHSKAPLAIPLVGCVTKGLMGPLAVFPRVLFVQLVILLTFLALCNAYLVAKATISHLLEEVDVPHVPMERMQAYLDYRVVWNVLLACIPTKLGLLLAPNVHSVLINLKMLKTLVRHVFLEAMPT